MNIRIQRYHLKGEHAKLVKRQNVRYWHDESISWHNIHDLSSKKKWVAYQTSDIVRSRNGGECLRRTVPTTSNIVTYTIPKAHEQATFFFRKNLEIAIVIGTLRYGTLSTKIIRCDCFEIERILHCKDYSAAVNIMRCCIELYKHCAILCVACWLSVKSLIH